MAKIISLSYPIFSGMPVYESDPSVKIKKYKDIKSQGSNLNKISFGSHSGTHIDAPSHILQGGISLDYLKLTDFFGVAKCINVKGDKQVIEKDILSSLVSGQALFLNTGQGKLWGEDLFYKDWPNISKDTANALARKNIPVFGIDTPSVDARTDKDKPTHRYLLSNGINIYECLANLDRLPVDEPFVYMGIPLPIAEGDGAPVNMLALVGDEGLLKAFEEFKQHLLEDNKDRRDFCS